MTDARLPGRWLNDPTLDALTDRLWRVHSGALMWSNEHGTDGLIPRRTPVFGIGWLQGARPSLPAVLHWQQREAMQHWRTGHAAAWIVLPLLIAAIWCMASPRLAASDCFCGFFSILARYTRYGHCS